MNECVLRMHLMRVALQFNCIFNKMTIKAPRFWKQGGKKMIWAKPRSRGEKMQCSSEAFSHQHTSEEWERCWCALMEDFNTPKSSWLHCFVVAKLRAKRCEINRKLRNPFTAKSNLQSFFNSISFSMWREFLICLPFSPLLMLPQSSSRLAPQRFS